ncbi:uncharacterized protein LOC126380288 isoform X2 [Pectinophora gossypiella]|uniref:uncharacterized protein LOC126380288 isoform X2 n=1 Tax=Pectinophora gossypiella TaxID=13191 RepID=UPI00214F0034|nr:uncharacterized protein LOC126380288 isoform X2 [Pectinophora gossypiella]
MVPQQQRRRRRRAALPRTSERRVIVARGPGGFGFTIAGQRPCVVSAVAASGPAERAGLRAGDALLAVDGASVARASHASVARLVAAAPGAIALSVAPREAPPTDTEDTEPDERARTRRRHPPPRRRPMPMMHHPGCHAAPSTSGVNEILQNLSRAQLTPSHAARLECRAVVGYLGTIETPQAASTAAPGDVRSAVRKLRQERRPATPVLLSVLPNVLLLRRPTGQALAQYSRERIVYAGCGSDADRRYFGLVTSAEMPEAGTSHSCHVFAVDPRMAEHEAHLTRAREFQIACTRDPVAERCLEFPPSAEYVVGVIRGMYSLPPDDSGSPTLQQLSKLAVKDDSPAMGNFSRCNRAVFRVPRDRRPCRHEDARLDGQEFVANSPQPSNHSEITTTSSNSDSGIGFHNDCRNIADRILVVDFAGPQPPPNRFRQEMPRRPMGLVGCSSFDADGSFLSNTTPVVDGFGGQGRPLNLDDVILNSNDLQPVRHVSPRNDDDNYNYNNVYGNLPSTSRCNGAVYDQVYTENESHYELLPPQLDLELDRVVETFNSVEIYEERPRQADCHSNESVENVTVISGGTSKASMDSVSVYSSRSHEEARPARRRHLQASLDDMLVLGLRDPPPARDKDDDANFVHPASIKCKVRKSIKPLNILSRTRNMLSKDREKKDRRRAISASAGDVTAGGGGEQDPLPAAASEPDLRDTQSEQSSPFRRWTTGSGAGSSYRHTDHRNLYTKQMSEGSPVEPSSSATGSPRGQWPNGGVARWSLGLEQLLADPVGAAAFAAFLAKEFAHENIAFWYSCEAYSKVHDPAQRARLAKDIWDRHLAEGAMEPVNIDATARRAAVQRLNLDPPPQDLFSQPVAVEMEENEMEKIELKEIDLKEIELKEIELKEIEIDSDVEEIELDDIVINVIAPEAVELEMAKDETIEWELIKTDDGYKWQVINTEEPLGIKKPPVAIEKPPVAIEDPPVAIEKSPVAIEDPPVAIKKLPLAIEEPPIPIENSPVAFKKSLVATEKLPVAIENPPVAIEKSSVAINDQPVPIEKSPLAKEVTPIAIEKSPVAIKKSPGGIKKSSVSTKKSRVAIDESPVAIHKSSRAMKKSSGAIKKSSVAMKKSHVTIEELPVAIEKSPGVIEKSPVTIKKPRVAIKKARVAIEEPPVAIEKSPGDIKKPRVAIEEPPVTIEKQAVVVEKSPVVIEKSPVAIEEPPLVTEKSPVTGEELAVAIKKQPVAIKKQEMRPKTLDLYKSYELVMVEVEIHQCTRLPREPIPITPYRKKKKREVSLDLVIFSWLVVFTLAEHRFFCLVSGSRRQITRRTNRRSVFVYANKRRSSIGCSPRCMLRCTVAVVVNRTIVLSFCYRCFPSSYPLSRCSSLHYSRIAIAILFAKRFMRMRCERLLLCYFLCEFIMVIVLMCRIIIIRNLCCTWKYSSMYNVYVLDPNCCECTLCLSFTGYD